MAMSGGLYGCLFRLVHMLSFLPVELWLEERRGDGGRTDLLEAFELLSIERTAVPCPPTPTATQRPGGAARTIARCHTQSERVAYWSG